MTRKRFIKLLMGKLLLSRNEANYIADIVRICDLTLTGKIRNWRYMNNGRTGFQI
jgi:hypothetical protein